ncbi:MAG: sulfite oxidase-like oxidoreductase [Candidatus Poribacteria bacterium]|nr:sulfite oxidase-like oxidoreductase [Candidatus Poribacteria bacterium]
MSETQRPNITPENKAQRTPPGQYLTEKFPVLSYGETPRVDLAMWDFRVWGEVEEVVRWTYDDLLALPSVKITADFHCVTTWSRLDNVWEGVSIHEILKRIRLKPTAAFAMFHCDGDYTTNVSMNVLTDEDVLLAYRHDGEPLTPDHGYPLRSVVPKRYAWKSARWLRGIEFMPKDRPGFWERNGYHMDGDPFKEERYGRFEG